MYARPIITPIALFIGLGIFSSCTKKNDKNSNEPGPTSSTSSDPNNTNTGGPDSSTPLGKLALEVAPVAAHGEFLTARLAANQNTSNQAGSLLIDGATGLVDQYTNRFDLTTMNSTVTYSAPSVSSQSIGSGPPEKMVIKVKKIDLVMEDGTEANVFTNDNGADLVMDNGAIDLSALATAEADGTVVFNVAEGTYTKVKLTLGHRVQVKGCVPLKYRCMATTGQDCTGTPTADIPGNNGVANATSDHLYCTQSRYSYLDGIKGQNANFEAAFGSPNPEILEISLNGPDGFTNTNDTTIEYLFPSAQSISSTITEPLRMTLVIDLNRMLRYYNRGRQDQGNYRDMAYFFSLPISESSFIFVGEPGRIYGYEMTAKACNQAKGGYSSATQKCQDGSDVSVVPFWMTLVTAPSGQPIQALFMPNEDDALTITKGTSGDVLRCPLDNDTRWIRPDQNGTTASIYFAMCMNFASPIITGNWGHLGSFPADLESVAIDSAVSGVTLDSAQDATKSTSEMIFDGVVDVTRRL